MIFDNHWQVFVIVFGQIGSIEKVPTKNENQIKHFETNLFDETSFSTFLGQK